MSSASEPTTRGLPPSNAERLFVRNDRVVEELDLFVEYLIEPVHCIRLASELVSEEFAMAVYEQVALHAYNDHLMTTSKELIGPLSPPLGGAALSYEPSSSSVDSGRKVPSIENLPSMMIRFFDQSPEPLAATTLETNVLLAVREVATRSFGWNLWEIQKVPWTENRHRHLVVDLQHNLLKDHQKLTGGGQTSHGDGGALGAASGAHAVPFQSHDMTLLHFTKRVDVIREVDITEQVLQQQEERAFREKQQRQRQHDQRTHRFYSHVCSTSTPPEKRLASIQQWLDGIERQDVKSTFLDASQRTVLHWIVDWSEDAYAKNRLGGDLLRSHIFFALELGISPLLLDATSQTAMMLATSAVKARPRAVKVLQEAAKRSKPTSLLPFESVVFESVAGRFVQTQFSATKALKFFTLELVVEDDCAAHFAIFLYDLALEWKSPIAHFNELTVPSNSVDRLEHSALRFYVVPFCRESHATTEGDILLCSNGAVISVEYTAARPRVTTFRSSRFGFDVVGGEGEGYCCTVQWQTPPSDSSLELQENREKSQRQEMERAALRVARSSYLSTLAQELHELEYEDAVRPKTTDELEADSEALFSDAFAERILLFPYGPKPSNPATDENVSSQGSLTGEISVNSRSLMRLTPLGACPTLWSTAKFCVEDATSASMHSTPSSSAPIGVVCVLQSGKLMAIPLSRFALTTHATAPLSERVSKLVDAMDAALLRHDTDRSRPVVSHGLFTPMVNTESAMATPYSTDAGDDALEESTSTDVFVPLRLATAAVGGNKRTITSANSAASRTSPNNESQRGLQKAVSWVKDMCSSDDTPGRDSAGSGQSNATTVAAAAAQADASILLYPKVDSVPLASFCKDTRVPIAIASTPARILIGLPNSEVLQYTSSTGQFTHVLDGVLPRKPVANANVHEPLGGPDFPCGLLGVDEGSDMQGSKAQQDLPSDGSTSTTVIWCGKTLAVRTVRGWNEEADTAARDVLVEDAHRDQETTSAAVHPKLRHMVVFSRRGQICLANLKTGFVGRLCPIVLSESELVMRARQMDQGVGDASSGVEMLRFNASGTLLMRYSPLYRSCTLYEVGELDRLVQLEERALVKSSNLICGFDDDLDQLSEGAHQGQSALRAVASVPKERLRGYLERLTTSKWRASSQARIDHAFFIVQAISECPTFHANVGDGDGRNGAAVVAAIESQDLLKDAVFDYWRKVLDDGGNLYQCSRSGQRPMDLVVKSSTHVEAILEYATRQQEEIQLRENAPVDACGRPPWQQQHRCVWGELEHVEFVSSASDVAPSRMYVIDASGMLSVAYVTRSALEPLPQLWPLAPTADKAFAVITVRDAPSSIDLIFLPSGTSVLVEHPMTMAETANGATSGMSGADVHRPVATIRSLGRGTLQLSQDLVALCNQRDVRATYKVEHITASWVHAPGKEPEADVALGGTETMMDREASRDALVVVGHVAFFARAPGAAPASLSNSRSSSILRHSSSVAMNPSVSMGNTDDVGFPFVADIPMLMTVAEWDEFKHLAGAGGAVDADGMLASIAKSVDVGKERIKEFELEHAAPVVELRSDGPFSVLTVREPAAAPRGSGKHFERRGSIAENAGGAVKVFVADASNAFCALPTFRPLQLTAPDGQRWGTPISAPPGNPIQCRPLYDVHSDVLHLAICGAELCVVAVDWAHSQDEGHVVARVHYFFDTQHLPVGESVTCLWATRDKASAVLHAHRGNQRPIDALHHIAMTASANGHRPEGTVVAPARPDASEHVLMFLKEGYLCVLDAFVRKAASVVASMTLHVDEIALMIRDSDLPDPSAGDAALAARLPLKVLCGGLHRLVGLTNDGVLMRFNTLHRCVVALDWCGCCDIAVQHADAPDEYNHVGGGIPSRTLVHFPSTLLAPAASVGSPASPTRSPLKKPVAAVVSEEYASSYSPPLKYDHRDAANLVAQSCAPPRSSRLKGYLSRRGTGSDDPQSLAQLLRLFMDAIESRCTVPSQRDTRGRTAMHILADLFPHLTVRDRIDWFNRLTASRCNIFACDLGGDSIQDRSEIRSFLYHCMGTGATESLPYRDYLRTLSSATSLSVAVTPPHVPLLSDAVEHNVLQVLWSRACTSVLYMISEDGSLSRYVCTTGRREMLLRLSVYVTTEDGMPSLLAAKVTAMKRSTTAKHIGDEVPLDHQAADIILLNNGAIVTVHSPDGDATVNFEPSGGFVWSSSVAKTADTEDPSAPSRLRTLRAQPSSNFDTIRTASSGLSPLCPSEQHAGIEVIWFYATGDCIATPTSSPVLMAVYAKWFGVLHVTKLYAPAGVQRIFPRHLSAMVASAVVQTVPLLGMRPERTPTWPGGNTDIQLYESARIDDKDGAAGQVPIDEVQLQRFTQITHAEHSPFGNVVFVVTERGFANGDGDVEVHVYSCPAFMPMATVPVSSTYAKDLAAQCELYVEMHESQFADHIAKQQLWIALERQAMGGSLRITDRTVSWCEGGGGMCVALWDTDPKQQHKLARLLTKGDHQSLRAPDGQGERVSVDACSPGYHHRDAVHVSILNGSVYTYHVPTGEVTHHGPIAETDMLRGDTSVTVSQTSAFQDAGGPTRDEDAMGHRDASFVAVHNLTKRTLVVLPFDAIRPHRGHPPKAAEGAQDAAAAPVLIYTPMTVPVPAVDGFAGEEPADILGDVVDTWQPDEEAQFELRRLSTGDASFKDPSTIEARKSLRAIVEEQHAFDMQRLDDQEELAMHQKQLLAARKLQHGAARAAAAADQATQMARLASKECTAEYWQTVNFVGSDAASDGKAPRCCSNLNELRTVERIYVAMMWPVVRGALPVADAVDGNGRTLLMHLVLFYASYFGFVDALPLGHSSRKFASNTGVRWERMKEEWQALLSLGASVFSTDRLGYALEDHYLSLNAKVGAALKSIATNFTIPPSMPQAPQVGASLIISELDAWRMKQRGDAASTCPGVYCVTELRRKGPSDGDEDVVRLLKHSPKCCDRGFAFVAPEGDPQDVIWRHAQEHCDAEVVVLRLPWADSGAVLVTPASVVAVQMASWGPRTDRDIADLSRVGSYSGSGVASAPSRMARSATEGSRVNKFTVALHWSRPDDTAAAATVKTTRRGIAIQESNVGVLNSLSHWFEVSGDHAMFQFAGWYSAGHAHQPHCFLRMWQCPLSFLKSESLSSFAQYTAQQLDDAARAHTIAAPPPCHADALAAGSAAADVPLQQRLGCVAYGDTVCFAVGSTLWNAVAPSAAARITGRQRHTSLMHDLPAAAWGSVAATVELRTASPLHTRPRVAPHPWTVLPHALTRCSQRTFLLAPSGDGDGISVFRLASDSTRNVQGCVYAAAKLPLVVSSGDTTFALARCSTCLTNAATQRLPQGMLGTTAELSAKVFCTFVCFAERTMTLLLVVVDVSDSARCGAAVCCSPITIPKPGPSEVEATLDHALAALVHAMIADEAPPGMAAVADGTSLDRSDRLLLSFSRYHTLSQASLQLGRKMPDGKRATTIDWGPFALFCNDNSCGDQGTFLVGDAS